MGPPLPDLREVRILTESSLQFVPVVEKLIGDVNLDGMIDFNDIPRFVDLLLMGMFQCEADIDGNGVVNFNDIPPFVDLLLN